MLIQNIRLQPLRIPTGWQISWNKFYEIDPPETTTDEHRDYFEQNMFFASFYSFERGRKIGVDLGWESENEIGKYILSIIYYTEIKIKESHKKVIKIRKEGQTLNYRLEPNFMSHSSNWQTPVLKTRSRIEVAEKMDEIMHDIGYNHDSKYWKLEDER